MKKTTFYISFIILILNFSCKNESKFNLDKTADLDSKKTTELITQILKDEKENYLSVSCITEKPRAVSNPMASSFDEYVKENLGIKDSIHYKLQTESYNNFIITKDLVSDKNIITETQFEEFEKKSKLGGFKFWKWIDENCKGGFCSISKPIFNETFDLAYVQIGTVCGGLCGGGEERIYEYKNGKWTKKESLGSWVS